MNSKWAVAQINAGTNVEENLSTARRMIREASDGCDLIAFPEFFLIRGNSETILRNVFDESHDVLQELRSLASEHSIAILAGSLPTESSKDSERCHNESFLIDRNGNFISRYRKIHLFDLDLNDDYTVSESSYQKAGKDITSVEIGGFEAGLTICYDLRFPELYRKLALNGVEVFFVPSNFTRETGRAHWEPLLRARAIENQCYVVAPNQIGANPETDIPSLGQSMVVDPWGQVIGRASDRETWFSVELSREYLQDVRGNLPCLDHVELFESSQDGNRN